MQQCDIEQETRNPCAAVEAVRINDRGRRGANIKRTWLHHRVRLPGPSHRKRYPFSLYLRREARRYYDLGVV